MPTATVRQSPVDLRQAAEELGVHYQTAYKWVRSGRLPASRVGGRYEVDVADVVELDAQRTAPVSPPTRRPRGGFDRLSRRTFDLLVKGDEQGVRKLTSGLVDNSVPLRTVMGEVFAPALVEVGDQWRAGTLDVATEHRCSAILERVIAENMPSPRGRRRGTAVVAAPQGDLHSLPTSMAVAALREDNWRVQHLGADMPPEEILRFCERERPDVVVLTVTAPQAREAAERTAESLEAADTAVLVGGEGQTLAELVEHARKTKR